MEQDLAQAEAHLAAVDRLDLIAWLDEAQREAAPEPEITGETAERRRSFQRIFDLPPEILTAPDPLAAILATNKHADEEADE